MGADMHGRGAGFERLARLVALLVLLSTALAAAAADERSASSRKLSRASRLSGNGVVILSDANYTELAATGPREYGLMVLFVARDLRFGCSFCGPAEEELGRLAAAYRRDPDVYVKDVFFAVSDYETSSRTLAQHEFSMVPVVAYWPATKEKGVRPFSEARTIMSQDKPFDANVLAEYLYLREDEDAKIVVEVTDDEPFDPSVAFSVVAAVVVVGALSWWPSLLLLPTKKGCWLAVSVVVYAAGVSGLFAALAHDAELWGHDPYSQQPRWISESEHQFVGEGVVVVLLYLCAAGGIVLLHHGAATTCNARHPVSSAVTATVCASTGAVVFSVAFLQLLGAYKLKPLGFSYDPWKLCIDMLSSVLG